MTENVIEKQIAGIIGRAEGALDDDARIALEESADDLQAATRPEQFMPSVKKGEWPEDAVVIQLDDRLTPYFHPIKGEWVFTFVWLGKNGNRVYSGAPHITIPPGIDPRIKVSRAQMEKWEAER